MASFCRKEMESNISPPILASEYGEAAASSVCICVADLYSSLCVLSICNIYGIECWMRIWGIADIAIDI